MIGFHQIERLLESKVMNVTEFKKQETKDYLTESNQLEYNNQKYTELMKKIVDGMTITNYPEKELNSLMEVYKNNIRSEYETYKEYYATNGISDFNGYLANMGLSSEDEFTDYKKKKQHKSILKQDGTLQLLQQIIILK